jgi:hypothetical protein
MRVKTLSLTKEEESASSYVCEEKGQKGGGRTGTWLVLVPHSSRSPVPQQRNRKRITTGGHGHVQMLLRYQTNFDCVFTNEIKAQL